MDNHTIIICGTIFLISLLVLILIHFWVNKYFKYKQKLDKEKCLREDTFHNNLNNKIDNLIHRQNETIERFRSDRAKH